MFASQHQVSGYASFPQASYAPQVHRSTMSPYGVAQPVVTMVPNAAASPVAPYGFPAAPMPSFSPLPSYVPPVQIPTSAPAPPPSLLEGLPEPASIESQKIQYHTSLDEQHGSAVHVMKMQLDHQIESIRQQAEAQKQHYNLNLDQQTGTSKISLTHQYNKQLMQLREAAHHQKNILEKQASGLELDYHTRKSQQDLKMARYDAQVRHYGEQLKSHEAQKAAKVDQAQKAEQIDQIRASSMPMLQAPSTRPSVPAYTALAPATSTFPMAPPPPGMSMYQANGIPQHPMSPSYLHR